METVSHMYKKKEGKKSRKRRVNVPWYLDSILSNRRSLARTSIGKSGVGAGFESALSAPVESLLFDSAADDCAFSSSAPTSVAEPSVGAAAVVVVVVVWDATTELAVAVEGEGDSDDSAGVSSSPKENSKSVGSGPGPPVCGSELLLRCRGVLVDVRREGFVRAAPASWADRCRACSSAMRASIAPRIRYEDGLI